MCCLSLSAISTILWRPGLADPLETLLEVSGNKYNILGVDHSYALNLEVLFDGTNTLVLVINCYSETQRHSLIKPSAWRKTLWYSSQYTFEDIKDSKTCGYISSFSFQECCYISLSENSFSYSHSLN